MALMSFDAMSYRLISGDKINNTVVGNKKIGYEFEIDYPSYRGTFLSCIEKIEVFVDNNLINSKDIYFCINGKEFLLSELKDLYKEYWFVLDKAALKIKQDNGISSGKHTVKVIMKHRIPYTGYFGTYKIINSESERTLFAE